MSWPRLRDPSRPLALIVLLGATVSGLEIVMSPPSPSVATIFPGLWEDFHGVMLIVGGIVGIYGLCAVSILRGVAFEAAGKLLVGTALTAYAVSVFTWRPGMTMCLAVGVGCLLRSMQLVRAWRSARAPVGEAQ